MGNKTGKFNVPATDKVNKDEEVINETDVKVESAEVKVEANGDHSKPESNGVGKSESAPAAKKKNIGSWFKKVSMRKEKKPKTPKENGVKEEVAEENVNGEIQSEKVEQQEQVVANGTHEESANKEASPEVVVVEEKTNDEAPTISNEQEHCTETTTTTELPNGEEQ